jgi:hypothetical protein
MEHFKYFIAGGGMAADAAVTGIRSLDAAGPIAVVSTENASRDFKDARTIKEKGISYVA